MERPIIFSGPMVRAILNGTKTQTRWVIKDAIDSGEVAWGVFPARKSGYIAWFGVPMADGAQFTRLNYMDGFMPPCSPGDTLWVRETWKTWTSFNGGPGFLYAADDTFEPIPFMDAMDDWEAVQHKGKCGEAWKSPMFMPRWVSRITLAVKSVRVERVHDITEADAKAEGVMLTEFWTPDMVSPARQAYRKLWDYLNLKRGYGWDVNPWVWVIEFERSAND